MKLIIRFICLLLTQLSCQLLSAQVADSIIALSEERIYNKFNYTRNPAVILTDQIPQYGFAHISGKTESGSFKRPMDAENIRMVSAGTGGYKKVQQWGFLGEFNYRKQHDYGLSWSSVYDAYNGNPFIWADSNKGKWIRDEVYASLHVTAPVMQQKFYSGLSVLYNIGSGARINEPKPFYRIRNIGLQPGVNWKMNKSNSFGISGNFIFLQEEDEVGLYSNEDVLIYRLRGYGTFTRTPMITGTRKRTGNIVGSTLHFEKKGKRYRWLIMGQANYQSEEVYEGIAIRSITGYYTAYSLEGKALLYNGEANKGTSALLTVSHNSGYADDFSFKAESASHGNIYACLRWTQWFSTIGSQLWQWEVQPSLRQLSFTDQATRTHYYATQAGCTLLLQWRKKITQQFSLNVSPKFAYIAVTDDNWTNRQLNSIINDLVKPHYGFISTNYLNTGGTVGVEFRAKSIYHILSFNINYHQAAFLDVKTNRNINQLQYSILF